jgi:hypothetical protein
MGAILWVKISFSHFKPKLSLVFHDKMVRRAMDEIKLALLDWLWSAH